MFRLPRVLPCSNTRAFRLQPDPVQVQVSIGWSSEKFFSSQNRTLVAGAFCRLPVNARGYGCPEAFHER